MRLLALALIPLVVACASDPSCPEPKRLVDGECVDPTLPPPPRGPRTIVGPCAAGQRFCAEDGAAICASDGMSARVSACVSGRVCHEGECKSACSPGTATACTSSSARALCGADGFTTTSSACPSARPLCASGACVAPQPICTPGARRCAGDELATCDADGFGETRVDCELGCANAQCNPRCGDSGDDQVGCDFVVVKLDNFDTSLPFAITVSNVTQQTARVSVKRGRTTLHRLTLRPETLQRVEIPQAVSVAPSSLSTESLRVESDTPITVHQFNPVNNVGAFSNDASLLLPASVGGTEFWVMGWGTPAELAASYATIVATEAGVTRVELIAKGAVIAGADVPAIDAGATEVFELRQGEVLSLAGRDMTGARITASQRVTTFVGHKCANVPLDTSFCDHLEEQLLPVRLWGTHAIVAKLSPRGTEPDLVRVLGSAVATMISTTPPVPGLDGATIGAGEHLDALVTEDFVLEASSPVLVAQLMVGSSFGCAGGSCAIPRAQRCVGGRTGIGDPSLVQIIPSARFASDYLVLVPDDYFEDHLSVVGPAAANVELDGARVRLTPIGSTGFASATVPVTDGLRRVVSDVPVGLYVYGYDCDVSYAYPGGLR